MKVFGNPEKTNIGNFRENSAKERTTKDLFKVEITFYMISSMKVIGHFAIDLNNFMAIRHCTLFSSSTYPLSQSIELSKYMDPLMR